jgi:glycosyltransferase involved in cell wall biosynthesis
VGISRFMLDRHLAHGYFAGVARHEVIPNGYRPPAAPPPARPGGGPLRVGFIGQLTPVKGVELLLREACGLPQGGWELRVAGRGAPEYEERLRGLCPSPEVRFTGFTRAEEFYRELDVLVVPSLWHEPFGMVVIEAFAHGVPVVGSRRGAIPELVAEGRTGLLFDPDAPGELRRALAGLVAEPGRAAGMRAACLERARDFDPDGVVRAYRALYREVAGDPGGSGAAAGLRGAALP